MKISGQNNNVNFSGYAPFRIHKGHETIVDEKIIKQVVNQTATILGLGEKNKNAGDYLIAKNFYMHDKDYRTQVNSGSSESFPLIMQIIDRVPYIFSGEHAKLISEAKGKQKSIIASNILRNEENHMAAYIKDTNSFEKRRIQFDIDDNDTLLNANFNEYGAAPLWRIPREGSNNSYFNFLL